MYPIVNRELVCFLETIWEPDIYIIKLVSIAGM